MYKQPIRGIFTLLVLIIIVSSCAREDSENVNQDSIFAEYRLVYESDADKTFARVTFRFGGATGTILELTAPSEAVVNNELLSWKPVLAYYEKEFAGVAQSGAFSYTDLDGNTFDNTVEMAKMIAFPQNLDSISQANAYELSWEGDPIQAGETVVVTINGVNEGDAKIFSTSEVNASSIILAKDKLEGIGLGEGKIIMERRLDQVVQEGTSNGGLIWSRYLTPTQAVIITN